MLLGYQGTREMPATGTAGTEGARAAWAMMVGSTNTAGPATWARSTGDSDGAAVATGPAAGDKEGPATGASR
jgi:hypothetical protein